MIRFGDLIRGGGLALAGAVLAGTLSVAPTQAMPIQPSPAVAADAANLLQNVQYRDWDRGSDWRWERRREMRRWDRERERRQFERFRRHREWERRNYY